MNVLYVEDYAIDAELVRDALVRRAPDIRLDIVATVSDAITRLNRFELAHDQLVAVDPADVSSTDLIGDAPRYDLILTDMNLPDGTGLDVLVHVRKRNLKLAVVFLTGSGQEEAVFGALHAGADDYVTKRGDYLATLPVTLRSALDHFQLETVRLSQIIRVLYAEPNRADVDLTVRELQQRAPHIEIEAVSSAGEVLEYLASAPADGNAIDVLLLDYRLPGMNAIDLVKELHQVQGMDVPVVLVTGHGSEEIARLALKLGVHEYMVKAPGYLERLPFALENAYYRAASARERLALLKSEREFHSLADNMPDIVARFDREHRHLYINPAVEKVAGIPVSIFIGLTNAELGFPPDTVALLEKALDQVFSSAKPEQISFSYPGMEGEQFFESFLVPEKNSSGKVETVLAIARNITERWKAEQAVRERGEQLQTFFDHFPGLISHIDRDLRYLNVNVQFEKTLGLSKEQILDKTIRDVLSPHMFKVAEPRFKAVLAGEKILYELNYSNRQGQEVFGLVTLVPDVAQDGTIRGFFHTQLDVTELKLAQRAVQRREAEMRLIADQFPGILSRLDRDLRVVFANAHHEELYGLPLEQIVGMTIMELSGAERFAPIEQYYRKALAGERTTYEAHRTNPAGGITYWYVTLVPDFAPDQSVQGVLVSALDITERRKAELAVLQRGQELSVITNQFPGTISRLDRDLRYRYVNDAVVEIYQRPREEILGHTMAEVIGAERFARVEADMKRTLAGERRAFNLTLNDPSGEERYVILNLIPDVAADGTVQGLFNIILDITDTRRAELAVSERERELSVITSKFPGVIARLDVEMCFRYVNERFANSFRRTPEDIVGLMPADIFDADQYAVSEVEYRRALAGEPRIYNRTYRYPSGEAVHFIHNLVPDKGADGTIQGFFIIGLDVTEVRKAEIAAIERERQLSVIADNFPGVISRLDRDFRILFANAHHEEEFGVAPGKLLGIRIPDLIGAERFAKIEPRYRQALQGEQVLYENTQIRPNGETRYWMINLIPDFDTDHVVQGLFVNAIDITERRRSEIALAGSEARMSGLIDSAMDAIVSVDEEQNIVLFNPAAERVFGWTAQEMLGQPIDQLLPDRSRSRHKHLMHAFSEIDTNNRRVVSQDVRGLHRNGAEVPLEASISTMESPTGRVYTAILRDVTERRLQEQRIQRLSRMQAMHTEISSAVVRIHEKQTLLQEVCRIVVEQSSLGMAWVALVDEAVNELAITAWWGSFDSNIMTGYRIPLRPGHPLSSSLAPQSVLTGKTVVVNCLDQTHSTGGALRREAILQKYHSVIALPLIVNQQSIGVFVLYANEADFFNHDEVRLLEDLSVDISVGLEYLAKAEHINYLAYYDKLTGLPNRVRLQEQLEQLSSEKRLTRMTGVALLDLARFRLINDSFGRQSGDELIKLVTARLLGAGLSLEKLARTESNAFVVLLRDLANEDELREKLEDILKNVFDSPFRIASNELHLKAKFGAVLFKAEARVDIDLMLRHAELALARAKKSVENIVVYRPDMDERSADALNLETRLRRALELGQFVLYYQPKIDLKSKKIKSVEALIRWQDPEKGLIPPGLFIPALEKTGMIFDVGRWVMRQAAADYKAWKDKGFITPRVAVNVSSLQLGHHHFVSDLRGVVDAATGECGVDLEITESVIMDNLEENIAKLNAARALGMSIAIDDFGTGYSSLSYLAKLPVTTLKIDRSFVIEMTTGEQGRQLVAAIITLAHSLKLDVVAEGVETEEQSKILEELDCDQIQGYLISRPVPAAELEKMLTLKKPVKGKKKT